MIIRKDQTTRKKGAQAAIEYLILLGVVTAVVLVSFRDLLPSVEYDMEEFFNKTVNGVYGDPPNASSSFVDYP